MRSLFGSRELLFAWTSRTIRARYQQSLLGWLWAIAQPAASIAILSIVFTRFVRVNTGDTPYVLFCCIGIIPWLFLATSLPDMTDSLVQNMNLVTKCYFARETLPTAAMLARLMDFVIAGALLFGIIVFYGRPVFTLSWVFLPLIILTQVSLILGIGLAAAALNVLYRDVKPLLALAIQIWFYASPIIYPATSVPERFRDLYFLNPMAGILQSYRDAILFDSYPGPYLGYAALTSVTLLCVGLVVFRRLDVLFADII